MKGLKEQEHFPKARGDIFPLEKPMFLGVQNPGTMEHTLAAPVLARRLQGGN